jgi:hypothetical protein
MLETELKRVTVKHVPHPVDIVARVIALISRVTGAASVSVIEAHKAQFVRKKLATKFYRGGDNGLLASAVLRLRQCFLYHAAQKLRRHKLAM